MYQAELPKHILPFQNIPLALASLGGLNAIAFLKIKNTTLKGYTKIKNLCGTMVLYLFCFCSLWSTIVLAIRLNLGIAQMNSLYINKVHFVPSFWNN